MTSPPTNAREAFLVDAREWVVSTSSGDIGIVRRLLLKPGRIVAFRAVTAEADPSERRLTGYYSSFDAAASAAYNRWLREAPSAWTALSGATPREPLPEPEQMRGVLPDRT